MTRLLRSTALTLLALSALTAQPLCAGDVGLVEKRVFELPSYTTTGGALIKDLRVGYESYGKLNAAGDNAIFIPHYYSGTSHAAGRYAAADVSAGYWDRIIGPGKAIDTDRYFVVSADTLVNLNVHDPQVTTTGPASIDPDTGKPWGMRFPVVAQRDSVRVHRALLESLGVKRLVATVGASGGSIQAMEWAALYPDFVERVVHVIGPGFELPAYSIGMIDVWNTPIRLDPNWRGGDYYGREPPLEGVAQALKIVTLTARGFGWADRTFDHQPADPARPPGAALENSYRIEAALDAAGRARARVVDANHMLYMSRANQLYHLSDAEVAGIKAKILFVPASSDLLFPPALSEAALERFRAQGGRAELFLIHGDGGHLDGLFEITQAASVIRAFLESD